MSNLVGLAFFLCIKATLIISKQFVPNIFSTLVFGGIPDWNPLNTFGCLGVVLISASLVCFYQHVKSKHYLDVLYTFREQLGLTGLRRRNTRYACVCNRTTPPSWPRRCPAASARSPSLCATRRKTAATLTARTRTTNTCRVQPFGQSEIFGQ
jgi:hypothetical protein